MGESLELRMYFMVPYNISPIQQAIQAGHAALEYAAKYGNTYLFKEFVKNHKTWIVLNGGTTNSNRDETGEYLGSLDQISGSLITNNIKFSYFKEPDLNNALTAVCFIADERVFNYKDYPGIMEFAKERMPKILWLETFKNGPWTLESIRTINTEIYDIYIDWQESLGGIKNVFLRELISNKKLA